MKDASKPIPAKPPEHTSRFGSWALHIGLVFYSLLTLAPFAWAVITSLKSRREIAEATSVLPQAPSLQAYALILHSDFATWLFNSLFVASVVTAVSVVMNTLAGYALARLPFAGRSAVFKFLMLLIMVPGQVTMVPAFIIVARGGLVDTPWAIILTSVVSISSIIMMRQFFVSFPAEVEEAATLDGCSRMETFFRVVVPMAVPALATQAIFTFMGVWNEFMKPLLYISSVDNYMLTQGLNALAKQYEKAAAWDLIMAGSVVSILPILALYIVLNKYFIQLNDRSAGMK